MVLLKLTVRATGVEPFAVEIEDEETVESLAVVIFSLQPEMGEDLRVAHKGRPLKAEKVLKDVGIVNGDVVAVARRPSPSASQPAPAAVTAQDAAPATAHEPAIEKAIETAPDASLQVEKVVEAAKVVDAEEASKALAVEAPAVEVAGADGARSPCCGAEGEGQAVAAAGDAPEAAAPAPEEDEAGAPEEAAAPEASQEDSTLEEGAPSAVLLALAQRLEYGAGDAHPGELAATLRRTAARVQALEGGISEFGQALQMVNLISAHALQGAGSQPDGTAGGRPSPYAPSSSGEAPRSFLVKRGDAELQEAHRQAALRQPELKRQTSGGSASSGGGALSTGAALSREEMDKARQARLAQLEAQQAQKKREQEEAAARSKAKEAMFQQPFVGPNKPLGKF